MAKDHDAADDAAGVPNEYPDPSAVAEVGSRLKLKRDCFGETLCSCGMISC